MSSGPGRQGEVGGDGAALLPVAVYYETLSTELDANLAALSDWMTTYGPSASPQEFAGRLLLASFYRGQRAALDGLATVLDEQLPPDPPAADADLKLVS